MTCACTTDCLAGIFRNLAATVDANEQMLNELDSTIGDAEHGLNLKRGFSILMGKMDGFMSLEPAKFVKRMGTTLAGAGCGSGPIFYGLAIRAAGDSLEKTGFGGSPAIAAALEAALAAIREKGGAKVGDKTMVDALEPAVISFRKAADEGLDVAAAFAKAAEAAEAGMKATAGMIGVKGRGFHAGERGLGHQDPGATSCRLLLGCIAETLSKSA
jgi:dihydroxyacetone kinase-like protein